MSRATAPRDKVPPEKFVPRHQRRCYCAVWFVLGALAGGGAVGLYWIKQTATEKVAEAAASPPSRPAQPKFEFYNMLPEMEVVLSEAEVKEATAKSHQPPPKPATEGATKPKTDPSSTSTPAGDPSGGETYLVQIGSFRRTEEAERLKAQLAMQGIQAQIQQVTINGKDTYYRVRTGALRGPQALNEVRGRLKKGGMEGTVIKLKG